MEIKFEIVKHIGKLSDINNGYTKELSFMAWNHREPVYDIRTWNQEHTKYEKGVTLTLCEMALLQDLMKDWLTFVRTLWSLGVNIRPRLSHSNSFGNDAEKDTSGCRALDRKYIVIEGE